MSESQSRDPAFKIFPAEVWSLIVSFLDPASVVSVHHTRASLKQLTKKIVNLKKTSFCDACGEGGHLELLKWGREQNCPWTPGTCDLAAKGGHLELIQYARAGACPWTNNTTNNARLAGHHLVVDWAAANGCPTGLSFQIPAQLGAGDKVRINAQQEGDAYLFVPQRANVEATIDVEIPDSKRMQFTIVTSSSKMTQTFNMPFDVAYKDLSLTAENSVKLVFPF